MMVSWLYHRVFVWYNVICDRLDIISVLSIFFYLTSNIKTWLLAETLNKSMVDVEYLGVGEVLLTVVGGDVGNQIVLATANNGTAPRDPRG